MLSFLFVHILRYTWYTYYIEERKKIAIEKKQENILSLKNYNKKHVQIEIKREKTNILLLIIIIFLDAYINNSEGGA